MVNMAQIGIRVTSEDKQLIEEVTKARAEDISSFARRAIRKELASMGYYSDDVRKALGVAPQRTEASPDG